MAEPGAARQAVLAALSEEIRRQGFDPAGLDLDALAETAETALSAATHLPAAEVDDGKAPEELNAANDG